MRVTLSRSEPIEVFDAIGTLEVFQQGRDDLFSILKLIDSEGVNYDNLAEKIGTGETAKMLVKAIVNHLEKLDLIKRDHALTVKGKKFLSTKRYPASERGKYRFWLISNPLTGPILIHFKREKADLKYKRRTFPHQENYLEMEGISYQSLVNDQEFRLVKLDHHQSNDTISVLKNAKLNSETLLIWEINLKQESQYKVLFSGKLKGCSSGDFNRKELSKEVDVNLEEMLIKMILDKYSNFVWHPDIMAFQIPYSNGLAEEARTSFLTKLPLDGVRTDYGDFVATPISNVPIMPLSVDDAQEWVKFLMKKYVSEKYVNPAEFNDKFIERICQKEFGPFKEALTNLKEDDFLQSFKDNKEMSEYWNLQTGMDLQPQTKVSFVSAPFHVKMNKEMSMRQLVDQIVGSKKPVRLVFCSKYVKSSIQIKKFQTFVEAFRELGVEEVNLISLDRVHLNDSNIKVATYKEIFGGRKNWPHDRYFAFLTEDGEWYHFKMSAELDQCKYEDMKNINIDTKGTWKDISFYSLRTEFFPLEILEYIDALKEKICS